MMSARRDGKENSMTNEEKLRRWRLDMGLRINSLAMRMPDEVLKANESTLKQIEDLCLLVTEVKGYKDADN